MPTIDRQEVDIALANVQRAQREYWDALSLLESELGRDIDYPDYQTMTVDDLLQDLS